MYIFNKKVLIYGVDVCVYLWMESICIRRKTLGITESDIIIFSKNKKIVKPYKSITIKMTQICLLLFIFTCWQNYLEYGIIKNGGFPY